MIMKRLEWNGLQSNDKERARREGRQGCILMIIKPWEGKALRGCKWGCYIMISIDVNQTTTDRMSFVLEGEAWSRGLRPVALNCMGKVHMIDACQCNDASDQSTYEWPNRRRTWIHRMALPWSRSILWTFVMTKIRRIVLWDEMSCTYQHSLLIWAYGIELARGIVSNSIGLYQVCSNVKKPFSAADRNGLSDICL